MQRRIIFGLLIVLLAFPSALPIYAQDDNRLQIMASTSIIADVARNVAGDAADVESLMPPGADPHSFQPTPSDLTSLADANAVFINGAFLEEGLLEVIENAGDEMNIVTVSSCVQMIAFGGHSHEDGEDHDHEDGEDHDHEDGEDHDHEDGEDHDHEDGEDHDHEDGEDHDHEDGEDHDHEDGEDHDHEDGEDHDHEDGEDHDHEDGEDHDHGGEASAELVALCEAHVAEMEAMHEDHDHEDGEDHDHEDGEEHDHEDGEEHDHEDGEDHDHDHAHGGETLGPLYAIECEGHSHDHDHEEGEEHSHAEGSCDPHVWMEPHNVMYWTMLIRDTLIELDPANEEAYVANAAAYLEALDELSHDFVLPMVETVPEENRVLVTNHDAFGYFAAAYDFEVVGTIIPSLSTLAEASTADVVEVIDLVRDRDIPAIFAETTMSDDLAEQIAEETGAEVYVLYSGALSDADGPASTYIDYIRYNVTTIVEALGGGM